jgi:hypothetical protein
VLSYLGSASLGLYAVTGLGGNFAYGLLAQSGNAIAPHIAAAMGKGGDSPQVMEKYLVKPTVLFAYASVVLLVPVFFGVPLLVEMFLPKFLDGLLAFYFFLPGMFFLSITITANSILNVILIAAVAAASTLAYAVYGLSIVAVTATYVLPCRRQRAIFLVDTVMPFAYAILVCVGAFWVGHIVFPARAFFRAGLQFLLFAASIVPMFFWLNRRLEFAKEIRPILHDVKKRIMSIIPGTA